MIRPSAKYIDLSIHKWTTVQRRLRWYRVFLFWHWTTEKYSARKSHAWEELTSKEHWGHINRFYGQWSAMITDKEKSRLSCRLQKWHLFCFRRQQWWEGWKNEERVWMPSPACELSKVCSLVTQSYQTQDSTLWAINNAQKMTRFQKTVSVCGKLQCNNKIQNVCRH